MRAALLLLVAGCDLVFPLDDDPPDVVLPEAALPVDGAEKLTIARPADVTDGAVLVVAITPSPAGVMVTSAPPGWTPIWDDLASPSCVTAIRHTIIYTGFAEPGDTLYEFELAGATNLGGLFFAYGGASAPLPRKLEAVINGVAMPKAVPTFPELELQPESVELLIVNCANGCGAILFGPDPEQTTSSIGTELFGFELATPTGVVPARTLVVPNNSCAHIAQLTIEPG